MYTGHKEERERERAVSKPNKDQHNSLMAAYRQRFKRSNENAGPENAGPNMASVKKLDH